MSYKIGWASFEGVGRVAVASDGGVIHVLDADGPGGEAPPLDFHSLLREWDTWRARLDAADAGDWPGSVLTADDVSWELPRLGDKCLCIGANYHDHISEMDVPVPPWPYSFVVPPSTTLVMSGTPVDVPTGVKEWDWEAEIAVVLGRRLRYATPVEAMGAVALYTPFNDLSARDAGTVKIAFGIDLTMIKAHDSSKVVGSLFTPARFVSDPQNLWLRCWVNGELKQDLTSSTMIYGVGECLAHLSTIMTLEPGDIVATGTGGGVGITRNPPETLHDGDVVVVEVEGLGRATTPIREHAATARAGAPA